MTVCPTCKARGVKLLDPLGPDYCGRCGRNWPAALSATVPADGVPPPDDVPHARAGAQAVSAPRPSAQFAARVGSLAAQFRQGARWQAQQRDGHQSLVLVRR